MGLIQKLFHTTLLITRKKYVEGKHYIKLEGDELRSFKASREIPDCHKFSAHLYLWTEKGALLHAKSLNTDKAWEVYDYLVEFYFRVKEEKAIPNKSIECKQVKKIETKRNAGYDIAPMFREVLKQVPIEALDEMEKLLRGRNEDSVKKATLSILSEKMIRQVV